MVKASNTRRTIGIFLQIALGISDKFLNGFPWTILCYTQIDLLPDNTDDRLEVIERMEWKFPEVTCSGRFTTPPLPAMCSHRVWQTRHIEMQWFPMLQPCSQQQRAARNILWRD